VTHREDRLRSQIGQFMKAYGRVADRNGSDPNDRHYSRELENEIKRMLPRNSTVSCETKRRTDHDPAAPPAPSRLRRPVLRESGPVPGLTQQDQAQVGER
jgi:hypothetical protein